MIDRYLDYQYFKFFKQQLITKQIPQSTKKFLIMMKGKRLIMIFILFVWLISMCSPKLVSTPPVKHTETVKIKIGQIKDINYPVYNFSKVYQRSFQPSDADSKDFDLLGNACWTKGSFIDFQIQQEITWKDKNPLPFVITQISQIQRMQNMLDVFEYANFVFVILKSGEIQIYKYKNQDNIELQTVKTVQIFDQQFDNKLKLLGINTINKKHQLTTGYFIGFKYKFVYFISNEYALKISIDEDMKVMPVKGIKNSFNYIQNVIALNDQTFIVLHEFEGIYLYNVDTTGFTVQFAQNIRIPARVVGASNTRLYKDFVYDKQRKLLFVLEKYQGIFVFTTLNNQKEWLIQLQKNSINQANCQVLHLQATLLYVSCIKSIYLYNTNKWPLVSYQSMPNRQLKVIQFASDGDFLALIGRNVIEVMYLGQVSEYQRKVKIQKLILKNKRFVSAYENGLTVGKYQIRQPSINCQVEANDINKPIYLQGSYWLRTAVEAQCQQQYFNTHNIDNVKFVQGDHCIYFTDINLEFYEFTTEYPIWPIVVSVIFIGVIALGVCLWILKNRMNLEKLKAELETYQEIGKGQQKGGHIQLVQEKENPKTQQASEKHDIQ